MSENGFREERTWKNLYNSTSKLQDFLNQIKVINKDRVAAYTINLLRLLKFFSYILYWSNMVFMLSRLWNQWSNRTISNRLNQKFYLLQIDIIIMEKKLILLERVPEILKKIKSIKYLVIINYPGKNFLKKILNLKKSKFFIGVI